MSITLIGLVIYLIFLVGFAVFSSFAIYHLWKFCCVGDLCKPIAVSYLIVCGAIVVISLIYTLISIVGA
ncbi:MAG: hypothetical protein NT135_00575 [Candidatus Berkelbacteria bacterium]|nr:hypothetical protein [Candidatus Berkelbacteria bacterium]